MPQVVPQTAATDLDRRKAIQQKLAAAKVPQVVPQTAATDLDRRKAIQQKLAAAKEPVIGANVFGISNHVAIAKAEEDKALRAEAEALAEKMAHNEMKELQNRADEVVEEECDEAMRKKTKFESMQVWENRKGSPTLVTIEECQEVLHIASNKTYIALGPGKASRNGEATILCQAKAGARKVPILNRNLTVASHKNMKDKNLEEVMAALKIKKR